MALNMNLCIFRTILLFIAVNASRVPRNAKTYKISTIDEAPYCEIDENASGNDKYKGFIPDLFKEIAEKINIKYKFHKVADGKYGQKKNGQWNGMIGEVMRKEADIVAAPVTITPERDVDIDFTTPFMTIETTFLTLKPKDGSKPPFETAEDLANQSEIKYGAVKDGTTARFFQTSKNPIHQKMKDRMVYVKNNTEGVEKVRNSDGKYVFIIESSTADYWINKPPCTLQKVGTVSRVNGYENEYAFVVPTDFQMKQKLSDAITELKDDGTIQKLREKWWSDSCNSKNPLIVSTGLLFSMAVLSISKLL